jgi:hypothetical protein
MASTLSKVTIDHDQIRRWAEARGAKPTQVQGTGRGGTGILRLDFPGYSGEGKLQPISWDNWFQKFDQSRLALVYQERTARGQKSNFNKLITRESVNFKTGDTKARPPRRRAKERSAIGPRGRVQKGTARKRT